MKTLRNYWLYGMAHVDPRSVNTDALSDIEQVEVNASLSNDEKMRDYIKQMKNPYCYRSNGVVVKIGFSGKRSLEECLATCFSMEQTSSVISKVG